MPRVSAARGSLLKVQDLLQYAKSDSKRHEALISDLGGFVDKSGVQLTPDELQALRDVINGTAKSVFAEPPPNAPFDKMEQLRLLWNS